MPCLSSGLCPSFIFLHKLKHNQANHMRVTTSSQALPGSQEVHAHRCISALAAQVPVP